MMDAKIDINKFIKFSNVSISVWWYTELEQKYEGVGLSRKPTRIGPKYSSAITNKLFFDIDCMSKDGEILDENVEGARKIWDWASANNYKRDIAFTGGGYQLTIGTNVRSENYYDAVHLVADTVGIVVDPKISLTDMRRVVGSYNFGNEKKGIRNCFCVSLRDSEVRYPWWRHVKMAQTQRKELYVYGNEIYSPSKTKIKPKKKELDYKTDFTVSASASDLLDNYGYDYSDICENIRRIIEQPHVSHVERIYIIKYLKDIVGMTYADCVLILPKILTSPHGNITDGEHSVMEKQPDTVYSRGLKFMPDRMKSEGYCNADCIDCEVHLNMIKTLKKRV